MSNQPEAETISTLQGENMLLRGQLAHYRKVVVVQLEREIEYLNKKIQRMETT